MSRDRSTGTAESTVSMPCIRARGVIFDGDDTLWLTEALYDDARATVRRVIERVGLDGTEWERIQRLRDVHNVVALGHSVERFPTSCVEALSLVGGAEVSNAEKVRAEVLDAARSVFGALAPLRDDAANVLAELRRRGSHLALLTKGARSVQERRLADSGLANFFDVVSIVERKTPAAFASVVSQLGLAVTEVVSVGNSVQSDIRPSLDAGVDAIWLPAYVWEYEERHDREAERSLRKIAQLGDLLHLLC